MLLTEKKLRYIINKTLIEKNDLRETKVVDSGGYEYETRDNKLYMIKNKGKKSNVHMKPGSVSYKAVIKKYPSLAPGQKDATPGDVKFVGTTLDQSNSKFKFIDHIKDNSQGNQFRAWVNDNHSDYAQKQKLDRTGRHNNAYIKSAWAEYGEAFINHLKKTKVNKDIIDIIGKFNPSPKNGITEPYLKIRQGDQKEANLVFCIGLDTGDVFARKGSSSDQYQKLSESKLLNEKIMINKNINLRYFFNNVLNKNLKDIKKVAGSDSKGMQKIEKEIADKAKYEASLTQLKAGEWIKYINTSPRGNDRAALDATVGKLVIPSPDENKSWVQWNVDFWNKNKSGHLLGLSFDLAGDYKGVLNKLIIAAKKYSTGLLVWDETGAGDGVTWTAANSPQKLAKGAHYHFGSTAKFKLNAAGEALIKAQGITTPGKIIKIDATGLKSSAQNLIKLLEALCKKNKFKAPSVTSVFRSPEGQVRIMLQQAAKRWKAKDKTWLTQYNKKKKTPNNEKLGVMWINALNKAKLKL